jgi:hypothetical protein
MTSLWGFILVRGEEVKVGMVVAPTEQTAIDKLECGILQREPDYKLKSIENITSGDVFVIYESE